MKILIILLFAIISAVFCNEPPLRSPPRYTNSELIIKDNCVGISQDDTSAQSRTTNMICCDERFPSNTVVKDFRPHTRFSGLDLLQRDSAKLMEGKTNCQYNSKGVH